MPETSLTSLIEKYLHLQEQKRKKKIRTLKKETIFAIVLVLVASFATDYFFSIDLGLLYAILAIAYLIYTMITRYNKYKSEYTESFIRPLMKHLIPAFDYSPKEVVKRELVVNSGIYPTKFNIFKGEDLFSGKIQGVNLGFSEVSVANEEKSRGSNKRSAPKYFLQGLFFYMQGNFNHYHPFYIRTINTTISIHAKAKGPFDFKKKIRLDHKDWVTRFELFVDDDNSQIPEVSLELFTRLQRLEELLMSVTPLAHIALSVKPHFISIALQPIKIFEPPILKNALEHQEKLECNLQIIEELISLREFFAN